MDKEKLKHLFFDTEERTWVRTIDALVVLFGAFAVGILFFVLPLKVDNRLLEFGFWGAILSMPVLAYVLYRDTNLSRLERIAILVLMLSLIFALMIVAFQY